MFGAGLLTDCGLKFDNQKYSFVGLGFEPAASLIHSNNSTGGNMVRNNARLNSQKTGKAFYVCFALIFLFSLVAELTIALATGCALIQRYLMATHWQRLMWAWASGSIWKRQIP